MAHTESDKQTGSVKTAPEPLEFLIGSWNRFEVLNALNPTPRTRDDLLNVVDVSRPTLSRILSDLLDRGWVRRRNNTYEVTRIGQVIAYELNQFIENIETAERLDTALEWFRIEQFGFELAHLADAEVLTPNPQDQTGPMRKLAARINSTTEMRVVATGVTYEVVKAICEAGIAGELRLHCVLDEHAIAGVRAEPELAEMFTEMIEHGYCDAYRYVREDDLVDYNVMDDVVMFCGINDEGLPLGILVSENTSIRSWALFKFEMLKDESEPIGSDTFTP